MVTPIQGTVVSINLAEGGQVRAGYPLIFVEKGGVEGSYSGGDEALDLDHIRGDLQTVIDRHAPTLAAIEDPAGGWRSSPSAQTRLTKPPGP